MHFVQVLLPVYDNAGRHLALNVALDGTDFLARLVLKRKGHDNDVSAGHVPFP
jgi:hypothetical protein